LGKDSSIEYIVQDPSVAPTTGAVYIYKKGEPLPENCVVDDIVSPDEAVSIVLANYTDRLEFIKTMCLLYSPAIAQRHVNLWAIYRKSM
jgi:hypothetical protein